MKRWFCALLMGMLLTALPVLGEEDTVRIAGEKVLKAGESEISYMTFSFGDEKIAEKINADAREQAQWLLSFYDLNEVTVKAECKAMSVTGGELLSLRFEGNVEGENLAHPSRLYYTTNYSLATGERLTLVELCDPRVIINALTGDLAEVTFEKGEEESDAYYEEQAAYLKDLGQRELTSMLRNADVWKDDAMPQAFSYWNGQGICTVSFEMPYALGEYAHVTFEYQ